MAKKHRRLSFQPLSDRRPVEHRGDMRALALGLLLCLSCSELRSFRRCDELPPQRAPALLSETGFDPRTAIAYRPRFELWSDGAEKRRWIALPAAIDTRDMDSWRFPVGTKLWKEFSRDGVRVETRYLEKLEGAAWISMSYLWDENNDDARAIPEGQENARGTEHDIPAAKLCHGCHGGRASGVLGFSAVQLEKELLDELAREGLMTHAPAARDEDIPPALGYLHANCSHCHNQQRPPREGARCYDPQRNFDLSLRIDRALAEHPAMKTAVGEWIIPGAPDDSELFKRVSRHGVFRTRMPPLGTELIDRSGVEILRRWILKLRSSAVRGSETARRPGA